MSGKWRLLILCYLGVEKDFTGMMNWFRQSDCVFVLDVVYWLLHIGETITGGTVYGLNDKVDGNS